ncbi:hypothetical protein CHCC20335_1877 [Bacillus paralicheniformis]|nr:hypothetical protein CHCC20335_1877 [Bacillus paralicheniformis]
MNESSSLVIKTDKIIHEAAAMAVNKGGTAERKAFSPLWPAR